MASFNSKITVIRSQPIYVGIDVHKKTWSICLIHCNEILGRFTLPSSFELLSKLLHRYEGMQIFSVYEAGFSGFHLHYQLDSIGVKNSITPPNKMPVVSGDKVKTDRRDSLKLAVYLSKGLLKAIHVPSLERLNLRQILRTREQVKRKRLRAVNQIKSLLMFNGVFMESKGITKKSSETILSLQLPSMVRVSIQMHLQEIDLAKKQLDHLEAEYLKVEEHKIMGKTYQIIKSVPGVGPLIAATLVYEIGDWERFRNEKQISAYFGLTPSEYSSGESIHRGRITGQGNPLLRSLLIQASWKLVERDPKMTEKFIGLTKQTGSKKKAIIAIARRLICIIYSMVKNGRSYEIRAAA